MRVGVIGAGAISRRGHLPAWFASPFFEVVGIADLNKEVLDRTSQEFGIHRAYTDYRRLLDDEQIEIVDVCTPTPTHHQLVVESLQAGKHVLVEKPLAFSLEEALDIYRVVKRVGKQLCVVQNCRFLPAVLSTRKRLRGGFLGKVVTIDAVALTHFPVGWNRAKWLYHRWGILYDFMPHLVDMVLWMNVSIPRKVVCFGGDFSGGDMGFANYAQTLIEFENNSIASLDVSWLTGTSMFNVDIHGTGGHIFLDIRTNSFFEMHGRSNPVDDLRHFGIRMKSWLSGIFTGRFFQGPLLHFRDLLQGFAQSLQDNTSPPVSVRDGVMVNAILSAAQHSLERAEPIYFSQLLAEAGATEDEVREITEGLAVSSID